MKPKHIIILTVILVLLAAGVVFKQFQKPPELATEEFTPLDLSFDPAQVAKIELTKGKEEKAVELAKENDVWKAVNFFGVRAETSKIDEFLKALREAKGELRAKDKSLFKDFGLGEEQAFRLAFSDSQGKSILTLFLGSKKPSYDSCFVRKDGSDLVYLSDGNFFGKLGLYGDPANESPKKDFWASLSLIHFKTDEISRIEARRFPGDKELLAAGVLRETDPNDPAKKKWKYVRPEVPFGLDAEKIKQFLNSIPNWKANKVLDPKAQDYGFVKPRWQMKLGIETGGEVVLTAGNEDSSTKASFIQVSNAPVVFELPSYYFTNFDIDDSKFFIDNPLAVDPDKTEKLVVHADTKDFNLSPKQKKWESLTSYLNDLKTFSVSRLIFDPQDQKKVSSSGRWWIEIQKEAQTSVILDVGNILSESNKEYAARKRDSTQAFAINESIFKKLFDNLDRLAEPKPESK